MVESTCIDNDGLAVSVAAGRTDVGRMVVGAGDVVVIVTPKGEEKIRGDHNI